MGIRSFRTGTGQKRLATEGGIYKGRAESFLSTRRTGLAIKKTDILLPSEFYITFYWHMYGSSMGSISLFWIDEADADYIVEGVTAFEDNYPVLTSFFADSNSTPVQFRSGSYQNSETASWIRAKTENLSGDGFLVIGGVIGSTYKSDAAVDSVQFWNAADDTLIATIDNLGSNPSLGSDWLTDESGRTSTARYEFTTDRSKLTTLSAPGAAGSWGRDTNSTGSGGTGPDGPSNYNANVLGNTNYMYTEASGAQYWRSTLRMRNLLSDYL